MNAILDTLKGKKVYIIAVMMLACVAIEKGLGIDIPGFDAGDDWWTIVANALGLAALRQGVTTEAAKAADAAAKRP